MADFTPKTITKSAIRMLGEPLSDVTAFESLVQGVITNNPFQCVQYNESGVSHPPVERTRQGYTSRIVYQDADAKSVGVVTVKTGTIAAFTSVANQIMADTEMATAIGGTPVRDTPNEKYTSTLKCRDPNGELYMVIFNRDRVSLSSYSDDAIRSRVETWADTITALA
jgi:hypothetical protein